MSEERDEVTGELAKEEIRLAALKKDEDELKGADCSLNDDEDMDEDDDMDDEVLFDDDNLFDDGDGGDGLMMMMMKMDDR